MKRQIKFRGKRVDTAEWVIGCLVGYHQAYYDGNSNRVCIDSGILTTTEVDSDTVGQFTGLLDKNGKEIYEGDVLKLYIGNGQYELRQVYWWQGSYWTKRVKSYGWYGEEPQTLSFYFTNEIKVEIYGNIHDNPELLKGGKECKC